MWLFLDVEIFAVIPGVASLAAAALLFVALKKVDLIKRRGVLRAIIMVVILFFIAAGIFLVWISEFWYVVNASPAVTSAGAT